MFGLNGNITVSGSSQAAQATFLQPIGRYRDGKRLCKYFYVKTADDVYKYYPANVVAKNLDICKGELYAVFEAEVADEELVGKTIKKVGMACAEGVFSSDADFDYLKESGTPLTLGCSLRLAIEGDVLPVGGENPLVAALLGITEYPTSGFKLASGANYAANKPIYRGGGDILSCVNATVDFDGLALSYSGNLGGAREYLLLLDDTPVLRSRIAASSVIVRDVYAELDGEAEPPDDFVTEIWNVTIDGAAAEYYLEKQPAQTGGFATDAFKPPSGEVKASADGKTALICDGVRVRVYSCKNGRLRASGAYLAADAAVCEDGKVFLLKEDGVYTTDGSLVFECSGERLAATTVFGNYVIAAADSSGVTFYNSATGAENLRHLPYESRLAVYGGGIAALNSVQCDAEGAFGAETSFAEWLTGLGEDFLSVDAHFYGGKLIICDGAEVRQIKRGDADYEYTEGNATYGGFILRDAGAETEICDLKGESLGNIPVAATTVRAVLMSDGKAVIIGEDYAGNFDYYIGRIKIISAAIHVGSEIQCYLRKENPTSGITTFTLSYYPA